MATFELYRRSTIGMCLTETLDEMVSNGVLSPELAIQVLVQFDKSMTEALDSQVKSKVSIKGHLHTYRFCDNVWTFIVQDAIFKYDETQENVGQVKIVAYVALSKSHGEVDSLPKLESLRNTFTFILPCSILQPAVLSDSQMFKDQVCVLHTYSPLWHPSTLPKVLGLKSLNFQMEWLSRKWFIPSSYPSGTTVHKKTALRTPFLKDGDAYVVVIELRDPKIHAIEFFLRETRHDKRLKMNGANFCIKLHEENVASISFLNIYFLVSRFETASLYPVGRGKACVHPPPHYLCVGYTGFIQFDEHDGAGNGKCLLNEMAHKGEVEKPLKHRSVCSSAFFPKPSTSSSIWHGLSRKNNTFSNMYAMSLEEANSDMVGEKSYSIRFLSKQVPTWIRFPASIVLPFGVFEKVLSEDINKEVGKKIASLHEHVDRGDVSKLKMMQETVLQMKAPRRMSVEVRKKMKSSRIPWPRGPGEDTWDRVWQAMKKVWASKWNEGAYMNHGKECIGILIQEHIRADYAFVTYTNHPVSRDSSQIYTEIVKGSVESLVGASSPGGVMSSITKKSDLKSPIVTCYPSKSAGFYAKNKRSIILRPDFVYENASEYARGGIYNSVLMDNKEEVILDYSRDPMVVDLNFQVSIHSKIAEAAKIIEDLYECAQDIEGLVQDGELYVLRCKPLIL
ncbi:hypothetical protein OSB04_003582 [Centaurea solstitialis]|uniref:Transcription initiation factor IIA subunit 2 n=1 Tax=Centaurea solstitialis TaxID=347529 RepID=A0AA38U7M9_9ASTR|nr:hypothetical protein OSB04_003582 [Centaurea solstitialis]